MNFTLLSFQTILLETPIGEKYCIACKELDEDTQENIPEEFPEEFQENNPGKFLHSNSKTDMWKTLTIIPLLSSHSWEKAKEILLYNNSNIHDILDELIFINYKCQFSCQRSMEL